MAANEGRDVYLVCGVGAVASIGIGKVVIVLYKLCQRIVMICMPFRSLFQLR